jgi:hypothetical protein
VKRSSIIEKLRRSWQRFKAGSPGQRFQQQFSRRQRSSPGAVQKALFGGGGILLMTAGIFFLFVPGPGLVILLLGAVLLAQQSLLAARALDWTEIRARKPLIWSLGAWRSASPALKVLLVVLALVLAGAMGFGAFKFLIANHGLATAAWLPQWHGEAVTVSLVYTAQRFV